MKQLAWIAMVTAVLAGGCARRESGDPRILSRLPAGYAQDSFKQEAEELGRWWESFGDTQLNALITLAFEHNNDIEAAVARMQQAVAQSRAARSTLWPTMTFTETARRGNSGGGVTTGGATGGAAAFGGDAPTQWLFSHGLAASYELDVWGRLAASRETSDRLALAAREDAQAVVMSVTAELVDLYFRRAELKERLGVIEESIAAYTKSLDMVETRFEAGLVGALDLHQARQNLAGAQAGKPALLYQLAHTEHSLSVMTGFFPGEGRLSEQAALPALPRVVAAGVPAQLILRRPDVRAQLERVRAADAQAAEALANRFPAVLLSGTVTGLARSWSDAFLSENVFWSIAASAAQTVFDGGKKRAEQERAEAALRERVADFNKAVLRAVAEVENALVQEAMQQDQLKWLRTRVEILQDNVASAEDSYSKGLTNYLNVLTAQQALLGARNEYLGAAREQLSNRVRLCRALGGSWAQGVVAGKAQTTEKE